MSGSPVISSSDTPRASAIKGTDFLGTSASLLSISLRYP
nr:MAG TPA: hypothetical protein [Ackermannviridae sp.]